MFLKLILFSLLLNSADAQVQRTETKEGDERVIVLENPKLKLVLFPDLGGRIGHMIDKSDGDDLLYWDLSDTAIYHGEGGALDDRRNTFEPYKILPAPRGYPKHAVGMSFFRPEVSIEKIITLSDRGSTVRVDYRYRNTTQRDLVGYEVMTKNWFFPSGPPISAKDVYCLPTSRGVRRIPCYSGSWRYPELRGKFKQDVGPWSGIASTTKKRGIVTAFSNDYYRWFYYWKNGVKIPTYEWVFGQLPAGQEVTITLWIHVVQGVDGFSFANRYVAADVHYDADAGSLRTRVFSSESDLPGPKVETEVRRLPDGQFVRLSETLMKRIPLAGLGETETGWHPARPGTYVIRQRLLEGKTILGEYQEAVSIGKTKDEFVQPNVFPAPAKFTRFRGWKKIEEADVVQAVAADKTRGAVIYLDSFAEEATRGRHLTSYDLHMGQGEIKSFEFKIRALKPLKGLAIRAEPGDLEAGQVEVFGTELVDMGSKSSGKEGKMGSKLVTWRQADLKAGEDANVWIRIRTNADDAGDRKCRIILTAEGMEPQTLKVTAHVRPVALPRPNLISLEAEHSTMILPGCWNVDEKQWNTEVIDRYTRNLGEHLVDVEQSFWGWFNGPRDNFMLTTATTGEKIREYLKKDPDLKNPPPIDYSYANPVFDAAMRNGLVRFSTNTGSSLPPKSPFAEWAIKEAAQYLRDRGYPRRDIWAKHRDEQPATEHPQMVEQVQWLRQNGFRPYSTFHNILAVQKFMKTLNPAFDLFQGGFTTHKDLQARIEDKTLDRTDEVWMYQGWGATWFTYERNRRPGWFAAAAGLDGYHVHVYYRWQKLDAIIFPSKDGPADSPAWEGMRDGMADAQYVALARRWIQRLGRASRKSEALRPVVKGAQTKLKKIIGGPNATIRLERKRDRLKWVERIPKITIPETEKARAALLDLLAELKPTVIGLGPSLYYGEHILAEEGNLTAVVSPASNADGAKLLGTLLKEKFAIGIQQGKAQLGGFEISLHTGGLPATWKAMNLHITKRYPAAGEYVIHVDLPADKGATRMLIFGRDAAGLEKGIRQWMFFLRSERPGAVR
ncbi:MAG: DUF5107 domain-containing protein [Planctomycetota bacterium]|jgi:hypothetical protein|nr:DUF5107 domain-containing protein [Planctomycetota bacterium]MDP7248531.1 DUF5107 domain-containing protein [Planctomycetota bacterium]